MVVIVYRVTELYFVNPDVTDQKQKCSNTVYFCLIIRDHFPAWVVHVGVHVQKDHKSNYL